MLDSSDVVIHVLDARDPLGTRCKPVVEYLRKEKAHKHLVYVLNKVDLVPTWVTVSLCSRHSPSLLPSTSVHHPPVKIICALRQLYAFGLLREWKNERFPVCASPLRHRLGGTRIMLRPFWTLAGVRGSDGDLMSWALGRRETVFARTPWFGV